MASSFISHKLNFWSKCDCRDLNNYHNLKYPHEINHFCIEFLITLKKINNAKIDTYLQCLITLKKLAMLKSIHVLVKGIKKTIEMHNENVKNNRFIMSRFINATCYLAFCEHDKQVTSINRGNYVEFINLTSVLDPKLSGRLLTSIAFSNHSVGIQIDLIQLISNILLDYINNETKNTDFFCNNG